MRLRALRRATAPLALVVLASGCAYVGSGNNAQGAPAPHPSNLRPAPSAGTATSPTPGAVTSQSPAAAPTSSPPTLQAAFARTRSGVVRFEVATCTEYVTGSGFAISPHLVVTVAHVINGGQVIRVIQGTRSMAGRVIGADPSADVALVQTNAPLRGYQFHFAAQAPRVGDEVAAIGFPEGDPLSFNPGTVNGLDRKAMIDGILRYGMVEMDAATQPGSSGGPVIRADGSVVGLVDAGPEAEAGRRLAVSSGTASKLVDSWNESPQPVAPENCASVPGPDGKPVQPEFLPTRDDMQAITTLLIYFEAINGGDYPTALAQLAHPGSLEKFREAVKSSDDSDLQLLGLSRGSSDLVLWAAFTSRQAPGLGPSGRPAETCTRWSLDYTFARVNGLWLISSVRAHPGAAANEPCPAGSPTPSSQ